MSPIVAPVLVCPQSPAHTAKFAPHTASLNTVKTNHKIVILFTAEKFITILGGDSQKKNSYRG